jgi:hypothetical protein
VGKIYHGRTGDVEALRGISIACVAGESSACRACPAVAKARFCKYRGLGDARYRTDHRRWTRVERPVAFDQHRVSG